MSPECASATMDTLWRMDNASENQTVDASLKMDHVFQTDFHKCHVTVLSCANVLTATGTASSIIAAEIQSVKQIQITISSENVSPVGKAGFHGRFHQKSVRRAVSESLMKVSVMPQAIHI